MTHADMFSADNNSSLLRRAVHRHNALSIEGLRERAFTFAFKRMVYAQIWEDPEVDMQALELQEDSRIVTIASGGCNVMSYLAANPEKIFAVDLNATHLALLRLKLAAVQHLPNHTSFARFFRDSADRRNVHVYDGLLRDHIDANTRAYWDGRDELGRRRISRFSRGFYRYGLLGRFIGVAHWLALIQGRDPKKILLAKSRSQQREIFDSEIAPLFDRPFMKRLLDSPLSLFGLGIPPAQYNELCAEPGKASAVVRARLRRLACDFDVDTNYFAWQAFNRGYSDNDSGPVPPYLEARNFPVIRSGASRVATLQINFIEFLAGCDSASLDRYVLLDAQDWMSDEDLCRLWIEITRTARPNARVVFRTAAETTPLPGRVSNEILSRWTYQCDQSRLFHEGDRSAIYGGFHLYTLNEVRQ